MDGERRGEFKYRRRNTNGLKGDIYMIGRKKKETATTCHCGEQMELGKASDL